MYKLMILIKKPRIRVEFDKFYYDEFIPKVMNMKGMERIEFANILAPLGIVRAQDNLTPFDLQIEMYFQNRKHFQYFLKSPIKQEFWERLSEYKDSIFTVTWGQPEIISKPDIVSRYNNIVIHSSDDQKTKG